ncbi:MAG TPA: GNAT family N-acetyltransferase [Prolixibacteraceae bacterium]|jgi:RimJ/RimL family protein N-acetyltransferase|nr:GNAT family N-acetyltransferase [Prolixibacteraceae bacterium]
MNSRNSIQIISDQLLLRMIQIGDAEDIFRYRSNAEVNKYQGWIPKILSDVHDFITYKVSTEMNQPGTWVQWVIIETDTQKLIGDIGIHFLPMDLFQVELGCTLDILHQGKGYATEALTKTINYLFGELSKHRITASIDPRNQASIALFERLGFRQEAHFRQSILIDGEWVDDLVYAMLESDWTMKIGRSIHLKEG